MTSKRVFLKRNRCRFWRPRRRDAAGDWVHRRAAELAAAAGHRALIGLQPPHRHFACCGRQSNLNQLPELGETNFVPKNSHASAVMYPTNARKLPWRQHCPSTQTHACQTAHNASSPQRSRQAHTACKLEGHATKGTRMKDLFGARH